MKKFHTNISNNSTRSKMGMRLFALLLLGIFFLPQNATAQREAIEAAYDAGSAGGIRGYMMKRIGATAFITENPTYSYYPASSMKIMEHLFSMWMVENNNWGLQTTAIPICSAVSNCNDNTFQNPQCNQSLNTTLWQMMNPSSNTATNALQEAAGKAYFPNDPLPGEKGRWIMNIWGINLVGLTHASLNSKFGCGGACGNTPNTMHLGDMNRIYAAAAGNALLSEPNRISLKNLMQNETTSYYFNAIVDQEAAALNKNAILADFKSKFFFIFKGGSWTCADGSIYRADGGLLQLPTYGGAYKRLFTYGAFLHNANPGSYVNGTLGNAVMEMSRPAIRAALLTWGGGLYGGHLGLDNNINDMNNLTVAYATSSASRYLRSALNAMNTAADSVFVNDSIPPVKAPTEELESAVKYLLKANRTLNDPAIDALISQTVATTKTFMLDMQAFFVSTADGTDLPMLAGAVEDHLKDAASYSSTGAYASAMASYVAAASLMDNRVNRNLQEPLSYDSSVGFPVGTPPQKTAPVVEVAADLEVEAWPNPVQQDLQVKVTMDTPAPFTVELFDLQGRTVARQMHTDPTQTLHFDVQDLPAGILMMKVVAGEKVAMQKLTVVH